MKQRQRTSATAAKAKFIILTSSDEDDDDDDDLILPTARRKAPEKPFNDTALPPRPAPQPSAPATKERASTDVTLPARKRPRRGWMTHAGFDGDVSGSAVEERAVDVVRKESVKAKATSKADVGINGKGVIRRSDRPIDKRATNLPTIWPSKIEPETPTELAVHPKKIDELRRWLKHMLYNPTNRGSARILFLAGPSGCGKTATLRAVCSELTIGITEWINPVRESSLPWEVMKDRGDSYESVFKAFSNFMHEAQRLPSLSFSSKNDASMASCAASSAKSPNLVLLEDIPNLDHTSTRRAFHGELKKFIDHVQTTASVLVIVASPWFHSDSGYGAGNTNICASFYHQLIPKWLRSHANFHEIKFNPVANTYLKKSSQLLFRRWSESPCSPANWESFLVPPKRRARNGGNDEISCNLSGSDVYTAALEACHGDTRYFLNILRWLTLSPAPGPAPTQVTKTKKRGAKGNEKTAMDPIEFSEKVQQLLNVIEHSARQPSTVFFHLLGKVLYNKDSDNTTDGTLRVQARLSSATYIDPIVFVHYLQYHYLPFVVSNQKPLVSASTASEPGQCEEDDEDWAGFLSQLGDGDGTSFELSRLADSFSLVDVLLNGAGRPYRYDTSGSVPDSYYDRFDDLDVPIVTCIAALPLSAYQTFQCQQHPDTAGKVRGNIGKWGDQGTSNLFQRPPVIQHKPTPAETQLQAAIGAGNVLFKDVIRRKMSGQFYEGFC